MTIEEQKKEENFIISSLEAGKSEMLNVKNGIEKFFYMLISSYVKDRPKGDISVCNDCLNSNALDAYLVGYGDIKDRDKRVWNKMVFKSKCDCCQKNTEVIYLPLYVVLMGISSTLMHESYVDFESSLILKTPREVKVYLREYKKRLDLNGIHETNEHDEVKYIAPIVRYKEEKGEEKKFDFIGISQGVFWRELSKGFPLVSKGLSSSVSSVVNAFVSAYCFDDHEFSLQYFINKIHEIAPFVICDTQYNEIEATSIFKKLHFYTNSEELDLGEFISPSLVEEGDNYLYNAYQKTQKEQKEYADSFFEYLEVGEKYKGIVDKFGYIINDVWKLNAEISFDTKQLQKFIALEHDDKAFFQTRWIAEATKHAFNHKFS